MLWNLFNFFTDASTGTGTGTDTEQPVFDWTFFIMIGVMIVIFVLMTVIPNRRQKKAEEEMNAKLAVGVTIMTAGGIIGEIVQMDSENVWIATGLGEDKIVMQFTSRAIRSIVESPSSTPAEPTDSADEVVDEIK